MKEIKIKFDAIEPRILTGLDALGRSQEGQKLDAYVSRMAQLNMMHWINEEALATRYAEFDGINTVGLLKTPQEVENEMKQAQAQQAIQQGEEAMAQQAGQNVANATTAPQQA
jgi:hypothetical protein